MPLIDRGNFKFGFRRKAVGHRLDLYISEVEKQLSAARKRK